MPIDDTWLADADGLATVKSPEQMDYVVACNKLRQAVCEIRRLREQVRDLLVIAHRVTPAPP